MHSRFAFPKPSTWIETSVKGKPRKRCRLQDFMMSFKATDYQRKIDEPGEDIADSFDYCKNIGSCKDLST
jgi:hypothetical protein